MDFREATDGLFSKLDHEELAKALGVSVATVRQARLRRDAAAHRAAPANWRHAVIRLAEQRVGHYEQLLNRLREEQEGYPTPAGRAANCTAKDVSDQ